MKRFIIDLFLILIIVSIGNSLSEPESVMIAQRLKEFDQQLQDQNLLKYPVYHTSVNQIKENRAGKLGEKVSAWVIDLTEQSVRMITMAFDQ